MLSRCGCTPSTAGSVRRPKLRSERSAVSWYPRQRDLHDRVLLRAHRDHRLLAVAHRPAVGERHAEPQLRMEKLAALEIALARVRAEHQAVEALEVGLTVDGRAREGLRPGRDLLLDPPAAILRVGVRCEPLRHAAAALRLAHAIEHLEHVRHLAGIVVAATQVAETQLVRLALGVARVLEEQDAEGLAREPCELLELGACDRADGETELRELLLAQLADGVPGGDVTDLVPYDAGELRLGIQVREDPARDVDEAPGERERVDHRVVHDAEGPGQVGALRGRGEPRAELLEVAL